MDKTPYELCLVTHHQSSTSGYLEENVTSKEVLISASFIQGEMNVCILAIN